MIITNDMERCVALHKTNQLPSPVEPCMTCARYVNASSQRPNRPWITLPPAFWNGERYVCEKHLEIKKMDSDRELLELAAKAAGFEVIRIADDGNAFMLYGVQDPWNPLRNALDALELACKLYMTVKIDDAGFTLVDAENWQRGIFIDSVVELHKDTAPLMATCRAIVRAAAEIGRDMP